MKLANITKSKTSTHIYLLCADILTIAILFLTLSEFKTLFTGLRNNAAIVSFSTYACFFAVGLLVPLGHTYLVMHQLKTAFWKKHAGVVNRFFMVALIATIASGFIVSPVIKKVVADRNYVRCSKLDNSGTTYMHYARDLQTCKDRIEVETQKSLSAR